MTDELAVWLPAMALAAVGLGVGETGALGVLLAAVEPERIVTAMIVWSQMSIVGYLTGPLADGPSPSTSATPRSRCRSSRRRSSPRCSGSRLPAGRRELRA